MSLVKGRPFKVVVADDRTKSESPSESTPAKKVESKAKAKAKAAKQPIQPAPVPALLWLSLNADAGAHPLLDVIRGRIETVEPTLDHRRAQVPHQRSRGRFSGTGHGGGLARPGPAPSRAMLVTLGLWPAFPKTPLNPQIYGKLDRDDYTIEKVVLETLPGFTLSGNLYRPANQCDRVPAILCPHGHWDDGRMNPEVQQRCIRWAKLGCVVFMYDMVGYNDSKPFKHEFLNDRLRRWGLSLPTLQTWNSIRRSIG